MNSDIKSKIILAEQITYKHIWIIFTLNSFLELEIFSCTKRVQIRVREREIYAKCFDKLSAAKALCYLTLTEMYMNWPTIQQLRIFLLKCLTSN